MKQFLLAVFALVMLSCSSDDPETVNNYEGSLIGTWKVIEVKYDGIAFDTSSCENSDELVPHFTFVIEDNSNVHALYTCDLEQGPIDAGTYTYVDGVFSYKYNDDGYTNNYEVLDLGNNKVRFINTSSTDSTEPNGTEYVLQKQ